MEVLGQILLNIEQFQNILLNIFNGLDSFLRVHFPMQHCGGVAGQNVFLKCGWFSLRLPPAIHRSR